MALPLLLAVTLALVWLLSVGLAQTRIVDATREAARALARGDSTDRALALARQVAPTDTRITIDSAGGQLTVNGDAEVDGVGGLLRLFPSVEVRSQAVASSEEGP